MKRLMNVIFATLIVAALASITVFADKGKNEKKMVTFPEAITVNGTVLKAGDYEVQFDETTGELSFVQNGKVKAKTAAHVETRSDKAKNTSLRTHDEAGTLQLVGVTFGGSTRDIMVGAAGSTGQ